jgi:hypothetical protein
VDGAPRQMRIELKGAGGSELGGEIETQSARNQATREPTKVVSDKPANWVVCETKTCYV